MTLGQTSQQLELLDPVTRFCGETLSPDSIYSFMHRQLTVLFPEDMFADLFAGKERRSVPPSVVAAVMVLQRLEGLSDREAVDRFTFDARWRYAAGVGGWDGQARVSFAHTVLVDMRERLRRSDRPDRVFEAALHAARQAGLVGRRMLDSTPLYDTASTMDTVTLIRSAVRGLLARVGTGLAGRLRAAIRSGDDYAGNARPVIDWDDPVAREELVDSRARDAHAMLTALDGCRLAQPVVQAAQLLATVVGQDLAEGVDGVFRLARWVAPEMVISIVDSRAGHGHKTSHRSFHGLKGHVALNADKEIMTAAEAGAAGNGDGEPTGDTASAVYGDGICGTGDLRQRLDTAGVAVKVKAQAPVAAESQFAKDQFTIDPARRDEQGLSPREKRVLILLAAGGTDDIIARRLGVSVRTARRITAGLLARLDARSRFQAGARATLRGWLTADDVD